MNMILTLSAPKVLRIATSFVLHSVVKVVMPSIRKQAIVWAIKAIKPRMVTNSCFPGFEDPF